MSIRMHTPPELMELGFENNSFPDDVNYHYIRDNFDLEILENGECYLWDNVITKAETRPGIFATYSSKHCAITGNLEQIIAFIKGYDENEEE